MYIYLVLKTEQVNFKLFISIQSNYHLNNIISVINLIWFGSGN